MVRRSTALGVPSKCEKQNNAHVSVSQFSILTAREGVISMTHLSYLTLAFVRVETTVLAAGKGPLDVGLSPSLMPYM